MIHARRTALMRLAVATRETLDAGVYDVYLEHLAVFSDETITEACDQLARTEQWFPKVATIRERCHLIDRRRREDADTARLLAPPDIEPISKERLDEFMTKIRDVLGKKAMK